jgi:hypothetical protein
MKRTLPTKGTNPISANGARRSLARRVATRVRDGRSGRHEHAESASRRRCSLSLQLAARVGTGDWVRSLCACALNTCAVCGGLGPLGGEEMGWAACLGTKLYRLLRVSGEVSKPTSQSNFVWVGFRSDLRV